jgi:hypothetical protein
MLQGLKIFFGLIILWSITACRPGWESKVTSSATVPNTLTNQGPVSPADPSEPSSSVSDQSPVTGSEPKGSAQETRPDQMCIKSLCGDKDPMPHPFENSEAAKAAAWAQIEAKVKKPLYNYMGRLIHKNQLQDQLFKKLFAQQDKVTFSPEKTGLLQSILYARRIPTYLPAVVVSEKGEASFNMDALKKLIGPKNKNEIEAVSKLIGLIRFQRNFGRALEQQPVEVILRALYPNTSPMEAQKQEALAAVAIQQSIQTLVPELKMVRPEDFVLKKAIAGEVLTYTEQNIFRRQISDHLVYSQLLDSEVQSAFQRIPVNVPQFLEQAKKTYLASRQAKTAAHPQDYKKLLNDAVQTCSTKLSYSYAAFPTQTQLDQFRNIFQGLQGAALKMIEEKKQTSLAGALKVDLLLPPPRENAIDSWAAAMQDAVSASDSAVAELKRFDLSDAQNLQAMFIIAAFFNDQEIFEDILEFCDQASLPDRDDATLRGMNLMHLSWATVTHVEFGTGIAAHELGHIVSGQWPELVEKEKKCLADKQGSDKYSEEDFADLFSIELLKRVGFKVAGVQVSAQYACSLLPRDQHGWAPASISNQNPEDTHSSGFYRLMAISGILETNTDACQAFLTQAQENRFQNYCRWEK